MVYIKVDNSYMQLAQFYPNRIAITERRVSNKFDAIKHFEKLQSRKISNKNLSVIKSTYSMSSTSKRLLRDSIMSIYALSKKRNIVLNDKKTIYNFRQSFITLTLPSTQLHTDVEIKKCLDRFLTVLRNNFNVKNYVWKAELQKNKNIHFHITLDKYISYNALRYYWNNAINLLGYVDRYSLKMAQLSINDYARLRGKRVEEVKDVYIRGVRSKWSTPNSVDVRSVVSGKDISNYLSKYFAKNDDESKEDDISRINIFGRVWSRSQSLSKLKYKNKIDINEIKYFLDALAQLPKIAKKIIYDYSTVIYIKVDSLPYVLYKQFNLMLKGNALMYNYPFP